MEFLAKARKNNSSLEVTIPKNVVLKADLKDQDMVTLVLREDKTRRGS